MSSTALQSPHMVEWGIPYDTGATPPFIISEPEIVKKEEPLVITVRHLDDVAAVAPAQTMPTSLYLTHAVLLVAAIALFSQFILAFFGLSYVNGFVGLVGAVFFFGLSRVFAEIKRGVQSKPQ